MGYQESEMDNEVKGDGNSYTTEFRQLDSRLGRWLTIDPKFDPSASPYNSMDNNNPIALNDPLGLSAMGKGDKGSGSADKPEYTFPRFRAIVYALLHRGGRIGTDSYGSNVTYKTKEEDEEGYERYAYGVHTVSYQGNAKWLAANNKRQLQIRKTSPYIAGFDLENGGGAKMGAPISAADRKKFQALDNLAVGLFAELAIIPLAELAVAAPIVANVVTTNPTLNAMFGFSTKYAGYKMAFSATAQAITNKDKVNMVAVLGDGFLGYGSSNILRSGVNLELDIPNLKTNFSYVGNGIRTDQFLFQTGMGFAFGAKAELATGGWNIAYGAGRPSDARNLTKTIYSSTVYSWGSNLLNRAYDEYTK